MNKVLRGRIALVVAGVLAASAQADEQSGASRQESIGVVTGLSVGFAAGGPFGAIVGGAIGGWLGDRYHQESSQRRALAAELGESEAARTRLTGVVDGLQHSLSEAQARTVELDTALARVNGLEMQVGFRTDDAALAPETMAPLQRLGELATSMPNLRLRIQGYADSRGSEDSNLDLSRRRAEAVAAVLADLGVNPERMKVEGLGESAATSPEGDLEGYALERRVTIVVEPDDGQTVASAH